MPAIQTAIRYTQMSREHVKEKLKLLRGEHRTLQKTPICRKILQTSDEV